jgi:hypothetical protein
MSRDLALLYWAGDVCMTGSITVDTATTTVESTGTTSGQDPKTVGTMVGKGVGSGTEVCDYREVFGRC